MTDNGPTEQDHLTAKQTKEEFDKWQRQDEVQQIRATGSLGSTLGSTDGFYTLKELMAHTFPPPRWAVEGVLPDGLTLLGGRPKIGKSWLVLNLALAVASGGKALGSIDVEQGTALFVALEDHPRRLQQRIRMLLGDEVPAGDFIVRHEWRPISKDGGGIDDFRDFITKHPETRLVVIDTLQHVRPSGNSNRIYGDDYDALIPLQRCAAETGVSFVVVHHLNKLSDPEDWLDSISGSTGLTGACDTVIGIFRDRGRPDAVLKGTGQEIDEFEYALNLSAGLWTLLGPADEWRTSTARAEIVKAVREHGEPRSPKEVSDILDKSPGAVRKLMAQMSRDGDLNSTGDGRYTLTNPGNFGNSVTPDNPSTVTELPLLPTLRGEGDSKNPPKSHSSEDNVLDLTAIAEALDAELIPNGGTE